MSTIASIAHVVLALSLAPLMPGVINRVKAWFAGRRGPPLCQAYYDLWKLLHKGAVYSKTTTWVFAAGPIVGLACVAAALLIVPLGGVPGVLAFPGDFLLAAYLLGLMRFFTILAALDTGSSFEGMGAGREAFFSALAEPALLLGLAAMAAQSHGLSLSDLYAAVTWNAMTSLAGPAFLLVAAALLIVFLAENARIPIDDPTTHLELTMIHEVMVLDHGGPDLGLITYTGSLKLWVYGAILIGLLPLGSGNPWLAGGLFLLLQMGVGFGTGVIESIMARIKLFRISSFLTGACVFAAFAFFLSLG